MPQHRLGAIEHAPVEIRGCSLFGFACRSLDAGNARRRARSEMRQLRHSDVSASSIHDGKAAVGPFRHQDMRGSVLRVGGHRDAADQVPRRTSRAVSRGGTRAESGITTRCCCQRDTVSSCWTVRRLALQQIANRYAAALARCDGARAHGQAGGFVFRVRVPALRCGRCQAPRAVRGARAQALRCFGGLDPRWQGGGRPVQASGHEGRRTDGRRTSRLGERGPPRDIPRRVARGHTRGEQHNNALLLAARHGIVLIFELRRLALQQIATR